MRKPRRLHLFGDLLQMLNVGKLVVSDSQPAEPVALVLSRPQRGITCPEPLNFAGRAPLFQRRVDCGTQGVVEPASKERFRGVRIFDITDIKNPKQVAAVQTCRGSHTHTLVEDPNDKNNVYIYVSGTSSVRQSEELAGCSGGAPDKDPNTALFRIDVIKVPLAHPEPGGAG